MKIVSVKNISMEDLRHLNLFEKISKVRPISYFEYNRTFFFCVKKKEIFKAIGRDAENLRKLSKIFSKRIKVIMSPSEEGFEDFLKAVTSPIVFEEVYLDGDKIILSAKGEDKAILIGRNKVRLLEMQKIVKEFFGKEFRIV